MNPAKTRGRCPVGRFTVQHVKGGYKFGLRAGNGQNVASSRVFFTLDDCLAAIEWVRKNAEAPVAEGLHAPDEPLAASAAQYRIYRCGGGGLGFCLLDEQGETVLLSEGYTAKRSCRMGIASIGRNAPGAPVAVNL